MDWFAASAAAALSAAAPAADAAPVVTGTHFFAIDARGAAPELTETNRVPLRPETSCYEWVIRVQPEDRTVTIHELLELPAAPEHWELDPDFATAVTADRSRAVTELEESLADGFMSNSWCVSEGDPTGPHRIRVYAGDRLLHDFRFEVVAETY